MKILGIGRIKNGQVLCRSIFKDGKILIPSGTIIDKKSVINIKRSGVDRVFIFDEENSDLNPNKSLKEYVSRVLYLQTALDIDPTKINQDAEELINEEMIEKLINKKRDWFFLQTSVKRQRSVITSLKNLVRQYLDYYKALPDNSFSEAEILYVINSMLTSVSIAAEMEFSDSELSQIMHSAFLHDIGRFLFPSLQTDDIDKLDPDFKALLREHPVFSYLMIQGSSPEQNIVQSLILGHHERINGTGYPMQWRQSADAPFSRLLLARDILSISCEYCEMLSGVYSKEEYSPLQAISHFYHLGEEIYNQNVIRIMSRILKVFPEGCRVKIRSNSTGKFVGFSGIIRSCEEKDKQLQVNSILLTNNVSGKEINPQLVDFSSEKHLLLE